MLLAQISRVDNKELCRLDVLDLSDTPINDQGTFTPNAKSDSLEVARKSLSVTEQQRGKFETTCNFKQKTQAPDGCNTCV